jgi:predicted transposase/invertase (TIGR01784 family)
MKKDTISKEVIKTIVKDISKYFLKIDIYEIEFLEQEKERIESRRADIVAKVNNSFVLHLEIQNQNDKQMPYRMLRYWLDIKQTASLPVRQYLIYIGKENLSMAGGLYEDDVNYIYNVVDVKKIDCELLLKEDTPDSLVLAVLCDFKDKNPKDVINYIIKRLIYHTKSNENEYRKYILMLEELSSNRDLENIVKEEEEMLSEFSFEKLPSYKVGIEKGKKEGLLESAVALIKEFNLSVESVAKKLNIPSKEILEYMKKI